MKLVTLYLVAYFALLVGAVMTLWQSDVLHRIPRDWIAIAVVAAVSFGILLALVSRHSNVKTPE